MALSRLPFLFLFLLHLLLLLPLPLSSAAPLLPGVLATLRTSGYSLSTSVLEAASRRHRTRHHSLLHGWNATGTLFLLADSAFKDHRIRRRDGYPRPPSASLFLYHAARSPPLRWSDLASLPSGSPIPTFSRRRRCLFVRRTPAGEPCLANSYKKASASARPCVKIRHPDLYFDGDLAIHGVDGVLDPSTASACYSGTTWRHHSHLDRAVRVLRRKGYGGVAREMERHRAELAEMPAVTIFAHRGHQLVPHGYDLRRHVAPRRYRLLDLSRFPHGRRISTMGSNSTVVVGTADGTVTVDGIAVDDDEVFRNGWAVVLSIPRMFPISDDVADQVSEGIDYADQDPDSLHRFPSPVMDEEDQHQSGVPAGDTPSSAIFTDPHSGVRSGGFPSPASIDGGAESPVPASPADQYPTDSEYGSFALEPSGGRRRRLPAVSAGGVADGSRRRLGDLDVIAEGGVAAPLEVVSGEFEGVAATFDGVSDGTVSGETSPSPGVGSASLSGIAAGGWWDPL